MNTLQLESNLNQSFSFHGVFARDEFLRTRLTNGTYIINTHPSHMPGEHWFVIEICGIQGFVFDSYGAMSPVTQTGGEDIIDHLTSYTQTVLCNKFRLQSLDTNVCGDYCLFYVSCREQGCTIYSILDSFEIFSNSHSRDHAVREIILKYFENTLPSSGIGFHRTHIGL